MREIYNEMSGPLIILHGGAGPRDPSEERVRKAVTSLLKIGEAMSSLLGHEKPVLDIAAICLQKLEDDPLFNAGIGSALHPMGWLDYPPP